MLSKTINLEKTLSKDCVFSIYGKKFSGLRWYDLNLLKSNNHEIAIAIDKTIENAIGYKTTINELKKILQTNLSFLSPFKLRLDFKIFDNLNLNNKSKLFGWVYYADSNDIIQTFRFTLNIRNDEIKYFD